MSQSRWCEECQEMHASLTVCPNMKYKITQSSDVYAPIEVKESVKQIKELKSENIKLESVIKKLALVLEFYAHGNHREIVRTRGEIIEYDVDAGPLYNYHENLVEKDKGEEAMGILNDPQVKEILNKIGDNE